MCYMQLFRQDDLQKGLVVSQNISYNIGRDMEGARHFLKSISSMTQQ